MTITTLLTIIFVLGYVGIALEHETKVNKTAIALVLCLAMWSIVIMCGTQIDPSFTRDTVNSQILSALGDASEILFFLIGAMTIVEIIDLHGGFDVITRVITTKNVRKLVWIIATITFFMSAVLDNMTTTIVMIMLLRKLIADKSSRRYIACLIVIAANSGGAWSPIGDVTTIMLWMRGNLTAMSMIQSLILPCLVSVVIPAAIISRMMTKSQAKNAAKGTETTIAAEPTRPEFILERESRFILILGVALLIGVPLYKTLTGLPPYMAMIGALGIMWVATEIIYKRKRGIEESVKERTSKVLKHIDMPTILFFFGILMSVSALEAAGILGNMASGLTHNLNNVYLIGSSIGVLSSVIDNVPLVAATMGMYPINDIATVLAGQPESYMAMFQADGIFWHLIAYAAGVGGSLLIIGSAAGVVAMGLEDIDFGWYLRKITLWAFIGYAAGILVYMGEAALFI